MKAKVINPDSCHFNEIADCISIYTTQELQLSNHYFTHRLKFNNEWIPYSEKELEFLKEDGK